MRVDVAVPDGRDEADFGGHRRVPAREEHAQHPATPTIRRASRAGEDHLPEVHILVAWEHLERLGGAPYMRAEVSILRGERNANAACRTASSAVGDEKRGVQASGEKVTHRHGIRCGKHARLYHQIGVQNHNNQPGRVFAAPTRPARRNKLC